MIERRRDLRIDSSLPMTLKGGLFEFVTETRNISASGAYCQVAQLIPPMMKLTVSLLIPTREDGKAIIHEIRCEGVVVRSERFSRENGTPERFFIAIYFTRLTGRDQERLKQWIENERSSR